MPQGTPLDSANNNTRRVQAIGYIHGTSSSAGEANAGAVLQLKGAGPHSRPAGSGTDVRWRVSLTGEDITETKVILEKHTRRARILIADDHHLIVEELVDLLSKQVDVVGTVSDGRSLVEAAVRLQPDVVIMDISMPGMNGIESLRSLKMSPIVTKVIFLTMHADSELVSEVLRGGASGFVLKHSAGEELMTAIDEVLQGRVYLSPEVAGGRVPS